MDYNNLTCIKTYDIRGKIDVDIDYSIIKKVSYAIAKQLNANSVVIGYDARKTSPEFANGSAEGVMKFGANVLLIGLSGTEEMYWAVTEFKACAGIQITASHNPIEYNGMKIIKSGSEPLEISDLEEIKKIAESSHSISKFTKGKMINISARAREKYISRVLNFCAMKKHKPLKVLVNCGNGAAGPTFKALANEFENFGSPIEFIIVNQTPDHNFPLGIPNPMEIAQQQITAKEVIRHSADFGIAFDGDFDRCFFFDEDGKFLPGEYIVGLMAEFFLEREPGANIVCDPRVIWNNRDIVENNGGKMIISKTGHAFVKKAMREASAVYGGEMSAHHYFRDFAYCDSGMIPWILMIEILSMSNESIGHLIGRRETKFPSSGEINYSVLDPEATLQNVYEEFKDRGTIDYIDGLSFSSSKWRFNLRKSNTEDVVRLNIETKGDRQYLEQKLAKLENILSS